MGEAGPATAPPAGMTLPADPTAWSACGLSAALAAGEISCTEVMAAFLDRIEAVNPAINAIVSLRPRDELMAEARAADGAPRRGWLHGLPFAVKDLVETAGIRTTHGSPLFATRVPLADDLLAARIRAAGAIVIGKTNTPEFGLGSHSYNPVHGVTRNPYDRSKTAGGSSGGAAAALAARLAPVADGSDTMGSLRNPAAFCNVYGFRPTYGRIPRDPSGDLFLNQISTDGPMARDVRDLAMLLDTLAGPAFHDPHALPPHPSFADELMPQARGLKIGWIGDWDGYLPMEPGILALCEAALDLITGLGAVVEPLTPRFDPASLWIAWLTLRSFHNAGSKRALYDDPASRARLKPELVYEIESGLGVTAMQVHEASVARSAFFVEMAALFETYDVLAMPSAQVFPFAVELNWPKAIGGRRMDTYHRWMEVVIPASILGLPALNVPAGFSPSGLPMGMQLIGPRGADQAILGLGEAYHQATDWPGRYPPRLSPSSVASAP